MADEMKRGGIVIPVKGNGIWKDMRIPMHCIPLRQKSLIVIMNGAPKRR